MASSSKIRSPDGEEHLGDLVLTKTKLEWCKGRKRPGNGIPVTWDEFIERMEG